MAIVNGTLFAGTGAPPLPDGVAPPAPIVAAVSFAAGALAAAFLVWWLGVAVWLGVLALGVAIRCLIARNYARWYWIIWGPTLKYVVPLVFIMFMVIGSMVLGWATPTESAAIGAFATCAARRTTSCSGSATTWRRCI